MTNEQKQEFEAIKAECASFNEKISERLDNLCNNTNFFEASAISHISGRLDLFIDDLNNFEVK